MTATTCRRCRGQEADDQGVPCARCDGYGIEPVFPPEGPEPGRDFIEWCHAKASQARRDTYDRTHGDTCWTVHHGCAVRRIAELEARNLALAADLFDALGQPEATR